MRNDQWDYARSEIVSGASRLTIAVHAAESRAQRASDAGAAFAAEVYAYIEAPEDVGLNELRDAYTRFMSQHAGHFTPVETPTVERVNPVSLRDTP